MARLWIVYLVVVVIAAFETLVQASYYLDDTDSRITYVGYWAPLGVSGSGIDRKKLYNSTSTYGNWQLENTRCTMAIPFNGTGITLYAMITSNLLFDVSIDGGPSKASHIDGVSGCCTPTIQPLFNYTFYSPFSDNMTLGAIWFDYAFVDSSNNPKPTASTKSKSRSVIGPAIVGAVGGILVIIIAILVLFWKRRQTRRGDPTLPNPDANILLHNLDRRPVVGASYLPSSMIDPDPNIEVDRIPIVDPGSNVSHIHATSPNLVKSPPQSRLTSASLPHSSSTVPSTLPLLVSDPLPPASRIPEVNDAILTAPGPDPSLTSDGALAAQEARFLRHLYDRNAPAEEIAELMQAMQMRARERERAPAGMVLSSGDAPNAEHLDIDPPAYVSPSQSIE